MNFVDLLNQPAFIIHIKELAPERTEFVTNNVKNAGYTNVQIFDGVNAKNEETRRDIITKFNSPPIHNYMSLGGIGCLFSHLKLYSHIIRNNIDICTIFEDDVHFHPNWYKLAPKFYENTPKKFDIIFIGNQVDECIHVNNIVSRINTNSCFCTHAYVITLKGAKKLMQYLLNWDYYNNETGEYVGHPLTGLFSIDVMIKNIQHRMNNGRLKKNLFWYCWNGTKNPCEYNKLPLTGNDTRNSGLVFQWTKFVSLI
jgi:glycosyl transferase family 25